MRNPRIYQAIELSLGKEIALDDQGANHIGNVLRMQAGQPLIVFNGQGGEFQCEIVSANKKNVEVRVLSFNHEDRQSALHTHLGQVISRGDRMDYALQKSVELGVSEITPLFSMRCEVKLTGARLDKKQQQWERLVISACEQSGLNVIPQLNRPLPANEWFSQAKESLKWLLHPGETPLHNLLSNEKPASICLAIGPEGGFETQEIEHANQSGFKAVALGPRVLRTETAPAAALSLLQYQWGDY